MSPMCQRTVRRTVDRMDYWMHQTIALERRDRWSRTAAAARRADDAPRDHRAKRPDDGHLTEFSTVSKRLLASVRVPRLLWPRDGAR
jgi:hypothetical protein